MKVPEQALHRTKGEQNTHPKSSHRQQGKVP